MAVRHGYGKVAGTDALVFAYDTGDTKNSYKGEPTTNLLGATGDMLPSNPDTPYDLTTSSNSVSNINGTTWDFSRYSNTNLAADGGIAWDPYIKGPGFTGAWRLKKRPGGNWETQFQNGLGSVSNDTDITISVWCKSSVAGVARINTNTTRAGSSYWGYSSAYHSGNGNWERLSVTISGGSEVTSINVIRCQIGGTTVNTDVYFRHFQVEYNSHPTQFTAGTRSVSGSLLDLTGNNTINLTNLNGYDSNAALVHDGTDDYIHINPLNLDVSNGLSYEVIYSAESTYNTWGTYHYLLRFVGTTHYGLLHEGDSRGWRFDVPTSAGARTGVTTNSTNATAGAGYYHVAVSFDPVTGGKGYLNGEQIGSWSGGYTAYTPSSLLIGAETTSTRFWDGEIPVVKIYNRALTAGEVKNNYSHYKKRFSI